MPEVMRDATGIMPIVRKLVAAGVAEHVRVNREAEPSCNAGSLDHP
jgi:hypothetical protein